MTRRTVRFVALAAGTVLSLGSLTAVSAATGQSFSTACADNKTGALRVLLSGGHCSTKEQQVAIGAGGGAAAKPVAELALQNIIAPAAIVVDWSAGQRNEPVVIRTSQFTVPTDGFYVMSAHTKTAMSTGFTCDGWPRTPSGTTFSATVGATTTIFGGMALDAEAPPQSKTVSEPMWLAAGQQTLTVTHQPGTCYQSTEGDVTMTFGAIRITAAP